MLRSSLTAPRPKGARAGCAAATRSGSAADATTASATVNDNSPRPILRLRAVRRPPGGETVTPPKRVELFSRVADLRIPVLRHRKHAGNNKCPRCIRLV